MQNLRHPKGCVMYFELQAEVKIGSSSQYLQKIISTDPALQEHRIVSNFFVPVKTTTFWLKYGFCKKLLLYECNTFVEHFFHQN